MRQNISYDGGMEIAVVARRIDDTAITHRKYITSGIGLSGSCGRERTLWDKSLSAGVTLGSTVVRSATLTREFAATSASGYAEKYAEAADPSAAELAARGAANADSVLAGQTTLPIHIFYEYRSSLDRYTIWRVFSYHDTSVIPVGATVTSATLHIYVSAIRETYGHDAGTLYIHEGMPTYPHSPLVVADYYYLRYGTTTKDAVNAIAYKVRGDITAGAWLEIAIPVANVAKGAITKLKLEQYNTVGSDNSTCGYTIHGPAGANPAYLEVGYTYTT